MNPKPENQKPETKRLKQSLTTEDTEVHRGLRGSLRFYACQYSTAISTGGKPPSPFGF
jgi:hypothetical protein